MKKILSILAIFNILLFSSVCFAEELETDMEQPEMTNAIQEITATQNKVVIVVQKQPLNKDNAQKVVLKKNWFGVYIQVNGKVKVNPLTNTYEVD